MESDTEVTSQITLFYGDFADRGEIKTKLFGWNEVKIHSWFKENLQNFLEYNVELEINLPEYYASPGRPRDNMNMKSTKNI